MEKILTPTNYEMITLNELTNVRFYTSMDTGSYVASHWHDAIEILYIQEGSLTVTLENISFPVTASQCFLISPNQIHSTLCTSPNRAIVFQIPISFIEKFIPDVKQLQFSLHDPAENRQMQENIDLLKETLLKMQFFMESDSPGSVLRFNSLLFEVLFQLYQNFSICTSDPAKDAARRNRNLEKITPILDYIRKNYNRPIPLSEIADVAALQPKYFCRFFKKCLGVTFLEYQNEIRLSYIYNDLINTNHPLSLILDKYGFSNYKLFRRIFRERFQCTPMELRKESSVLRGNTLRKSP